MKYVSIVLILTRFVNVFVAYAYVVCNYIIRKPIHDNFKQYRKD